MKKNYRLRTIKALFWTKQKNADAKIKTDHRYRIEEAGYE